MLVVEDDADIRDCLRVALEDEGYQTFTAANGQDALDRLEFGLVPDVILLDLMMPVLNGFEFLDEVRKYPKWSKIPVVVLSANQGFDHVDLGVFAAVKKPFDLDRLLPLLRRAIRLAA